MHALPIACLLALSHVLPAAPALQTSLAPFVQYSNLYVLAVAQANVNAAATLVFLHKLIDIFKHYFQEVRGAAAGGWQNNGRLQSMRAHGEDAVPGRLHEETATLCRPPLTAHLPACTALQLEEESLRDNFVIAYELLDEVIDHGYFQVCTRVSLAAG